MKNPRPFSIRHFQYLLLQTALITVSSMVVFGQEIQPSGPMGSLPRPGDAHYYEYASARLRQQRKPDAASPIPLEELRGEFLKLQISNNDLFELRQKPTDSDSIAVCLGDIRKRAAALNRKLPLPAPDKSLKSRQGLESLSMEAEFDLLDRTVLRFAASPAFKNAAVLDVNSGEQARRDLELILALSENLKNHVSALTKSKEQ